MHLRESFYRRQRRKQRLELGLQPSSLFLFSSPLQNFYRRQRSKRRFELGLQHFVIFASFCLVFSAALLRIGWEIERGFRGSDRILSRPSWSDVVFPFYDAEEIGPRMPCADCKENRV